MSIALARGDPIPPNPMKKNHSPRGKFSAFRLLAFAFATVAILAAREVINHKDGTPAKKLGDVTTALKTHAEIRLGLDRVELAGIPLPKGMTREKR